MVRRTLYAADTIGIVLAVVVLTQMGSPSRWYLILLPVWIVVAGLYGLYDGGEEQAHHSTARDVTTVFHVCTVSSLVLLGLSLLAGTVVDSQAVVGFWILSMVFVLSARFVARGIVRRSSAYLQNTVIVGAGDIGQLIARKILQHPEYGIRLVGFVDANPKEQRRDIGELAILGNMGELKDIIDRLAIERVVVAFSRESNEDTLALVRSLRSVPVQVDIVPRLFEAVGPSAEIRSIEGLPLVGLPSVRITRASRWAKRVLDVCVAGPLLVLLIPVFAFVAVRVRLDSRGPVLFRQKRLGRDLVPFTMLKFRTMRVDVDETVHRDYIGKAMDVSLPPNENGLYKLEREDAVTPFGRWLRRTSLDELPQLINVLRGEMSLVGPRPCIAYETEFFAPHHFERFLVPQGITGLWQVEGRALMTPREALDLDVAYARNWSLGLDFALLARTLWQVLLRKGAS